MKDQKITIVDYGMGNLFSIERAINYIGAKAEITSDRLKIANADKLILPGVGAFGKAMDELKERKIIEAVYRFVESKKPLLGICLGMQLLFTESFEFGHHKGLDLIKGRVIRFRDPDPNWVNFKIPQIGWNKIKSPGEEPWDYWKNTILESIPTGCFFYFVHSYICVPENKKYSIAESEYGKDLYCAVINKDNVWGCQFHPEKSGEAGLKIYRNFLKI
ncbi:imidazole glycerol phosphate synthase subunit HisH [Candidatus Micrarchaeota archaeon]|nr:imidazole glycerol phosphate synthase subunit HisH [Candidatus Micrarchaeota archaeon]